MKDNSKEILKENVKGSQFPENNLMRLIEWLRCRLWWFDVAYPVAVALLIFASLTYIVYGGRESARLALIFERVLLQISLKITPEYPLKKQGSIATITADIHSSKYMNNLKNDSVPDLSAEAYAKAIDQLIQLKIPNIAVIWRPEDHLKTHRYYEPLRQVLSVAHPHSNIVFLMADNSIDDLPAHIASLVTTLDGDSCADKDLEKFQSMCGNNEASTNWFPRWLINRYLVTQSNYSGSEKKWITYQLPSNLGAYITNLPHPDQIPNHSFDDLLDGRVKFERTPEIIFLGVDLSGAVASDQLTTLPVAIRTQHSHYFSRLAATISGVPLHRYWATIAQAMIEGRLPDVASEIYGAVLIVFFGAFIVFLMAKTNGTIATVFFVSWIICGPFLNAILLRWQNFYMPLSNSYYVGLLLLITSGFLRLSLTAFRRWQADERSRAHIQAADLKANFVSLVSHNLNTPVAKMQGMLSLLASYQSQTTSHREPRLGDLEQRIKCADQYVAQLQLVIRAVLISTAIEENAVNNTPRTMAQILDDFNLNYNQTLLRLGIDAKVTTAFIDENEFKFLPLSFDTRALTTTIAAIAALYSFANSDDQDKENHHHEQNHPALKFVNLAITPQFEEFDSEICISLSFQVADKFNIHSERLTYLIYNAINKRHGAIIGTSVAESDDRKHFCRQVLSNLVAIVLKNYRGKIDMTDLGIRIMVKPQQTGLEFAVLSDS